MDQRHQHALPPARSRWLAPLGAVVVLALLLAWWRPWRAGPAPQPAPRATATLPGMSPTRAPERIALPTTLPPRAATATVANASDRAGGTPATPAGPAVAAAGRLLYLGTLAGRRGVIAVNADGGDQRLLAEGAYSELAWSPDGARFAAAGPILSGGGAYQVAIFAPDGRALARYPFARQLSSPIRWSPSGKYLLCFALGGNAPAQPPESWVIGDDGPRAITMPSGASSYPYGWTPDNRIAFFTTADLGQPQALTVWTTDAAGGDPQKIHEGPIVPLGWGFDGSLLYAFTFGGDPRPNAALSQLIAIELAWDSARYLAGADALAATVLGVPVAPNSYRFDLAALSPDDGRFALVLFRGAGLGTPIPRAEARTGVIVFMRAYGRIDGTAPLTASGGLGPAAWSPDGTHLALFVFGDQPGENQLRIFDPTGATIAAYRASGVVATGPPQVAWSADGNWIAYTRPDGLVVAAIGSTRNLLLAPDGSAPAWRP